MTELTDVQGLTVVRVYLTVFPGGVQLIKEGKLKVKTGIRDYCI